MGGYQDQDQARARMEKNKLGRGQNNNRWRLSNSPRWGIDKVQAHAPRGLAYRLLMNSVVWQSGATREEMRFIRRLRRKKIAR
jgi:hypothetical protein